MSVGPDNIFLLQDFNYLDNKIKIQGLFKTKKHKYNLIFNISPDNNSFSSQIKEYPAEDNDVQNKARKPYFYFYLYSKCRICDLSEANSTDIEIDLLSNQLKNIGLEHENILLLDEQDGFRIEFEYDSNTTLIRKCMISKDFIKDDNKKALCFSILDLDFADKNKLLNKIKTLVLFS